MEIPKKVENNIADNIGETLFITLYMRCKETKRDDSIIKDPIACEMLEKIDSDFSKYDKAVRSLVGVALRVKHFDDTVKGFIERTDNPIVVIIGCGLDTRYQRLGNLTDKAIFYELDLPEVIKLREQLLPASENDIYLPNSMLETKWMDVLKEKHLDGQFIFIIEGTVMYFEGEDVKTVFVNLAKRFHGSEIHFDVVNKWMSRNSHIHDTVKLTNATFKYGIDDDREIENWASNLKYQSTKLYSNFKEWKRAGLINGLLMKLIPRFKYGGRLLHYTIHHKI